MTQLGKYEIIKEIGRGGFGVVYKARDLSLDRIVTLKVLHPQLTVDPKFIANFKREARNLAKVENPNIVTIYEIGEAEGRSFIAMRYLPGGSLADRIAKGPLEKEAALKIINQIADGLGAGHERGIIHRDIKPSNILFDEHDNAIVTDFGVAKAVHLSSQGTASETGGGIGTPYYRPPELWRGSPPPTPATDIYSLGCVLYEMLTCEVLFKGDTPDQVLTRHILDEAQSLITPNQELLSKPIISILNLMLSKSPEERYQTMLEFKNAIQTQISAKPNQVSEEPKLDIQVSTSELYSNQGQQEKSSMSGSNHAFKSIRENEELGKEAKSELKKKRKSIPQIFLYLAIFISVGFFIILVMQSLNNNSLPTSVKSTATSGFKTVTIPKTPTKTPTSIDPTESDLGTFKEPLIWALVPSGEADTVLAGFNAVTDIIYDETGIVIEPFVSIDYKGVIDALTADPPLAHITSLPTFAYLIASERGVAEAELVAVRYGDPSYNGQIYARVNSGINSIEDITGKIFCRPDPLSTSGWIIPSFTMRAAGVYPEDLAAIIDAGSHDAAVAGVYNGDCDAGSSFVDARLNLEEDYPDVMDVIKIINVSVDIPNDGVQYHPMVSEALRENIDQVLMDMSNIEGGGEALDSAYEWSELTPKGDEFYDPFRQVLRAAGVNVEDFYDW
jgi:phosphate/phosphite/phosphonate ABC transporter binding protein